MKKILLSTLKIGLPLAFGVFLIWYVMNDLTEEQKVDLMDAFRRADYIWVIVSMILGGLSHLSRAIRWKYTIEPLGYQPKTANLFFGVMIGYIANLLFPRLGEVSRPAVVGKYEDIPFDKLFGTIVAERIADLIILASLLTGAVLSQLDLLRDLLDETLSNGGDKFSVEKIALLGGGVILGLAVLFFIMLRQSDNPLFKKLRSLISGVWEGILSILRMKKLGAFLFHTFLIWFLYVMMFYVCFFALPETADVPIAGVIAAFGLGGLSIVFVQGGIGVYPAAIMKTLTLYAVAESIAYALGWIIWASQTLMIILIGVASIILIRRFNAKKASHADA